ncbi:MAG: DNA methyltransferase [Candidatus Omnitrophica bacterium]|nr:DNA methyltransferase [Candidatus Omnitrophota bacterium]
MINEKITYIAPNISLDICKRYSKVYDLHKYWSRKPWYSINECVRKFSNEKELVLDMFVGSGVTALESSLLNRDFVGFDLNPMSIFICKNTIFNNFNTADFQKELEEIAEKLESLSKDLYSTNEKCPLCHDQLISQHINIGPAFKGKETGHFYCSKCGSRIKVIRELNKYDLEQMAKKHHIKKWVPTNTFPKKFYKDRFSYKGILKVTDMFTNRNLYYLSELFGVINKSNFKYKNLFLVAFSNTILHASKLKSENVRPLSVNNYWIPDDYFEENPWPRFLDRVDLIIEAKQILLERLEKTRLGEMAFHNKSCFKTGLKDESVDYIITDPPYGDAIQYSELSFIWNSWLGFNYDIEEEVIINPEQGKKVNEFLVLLEKSIAEANRVLKKGKYFTLCFHNKEFKIWGGVLNIFKKYNFVLENVEIVDTKGNSYNSNWAKFSPKTDLYLTFKKSKFRYTHKIEYSLHSLLSSILQKYNLDNPVEVYDVLVVDLVQELYFNEHQVDISKLTIKKLAELISEIKNGN